jgi:hypothetical protein
VSKFSMGAILGNHGNAAVVVIGNDVIRLNSLLAATGNEDLPGGFGLSEMLDHWDVWLPRRLRRWLHDINDVSARDWVASSPKFLGIDWMVGKSIDGYAPIASMCAESFLTQKLPVPTELANRLLPAAAFVLCTQKSKLGRIQP